LRGGADEASLSSQNHGGERESSGVRKTSASTLCQTHPIITSPRPAHNAPDTACPIIARQAPGSPSISDPLGDTRGAEACHRHPFPAPPGSSRPNFFPYQAPATALGPPTSGIRTRPGASHNFVAYPCPSLGLCVWMFVGGVCVVSCHDKNAIRCVINNVHMQRDMAKTKHPSPPPQQ